MSFSKYHQIFSMDNIFLIPVDDTYDHNVNNSSFVDYSSNDTNDNSDTVSTDECSPKQYSQFKFEEKKTIQIQNIFKWNYIQIIKSLKMKTKEDYINLCINNNNNIFK